MNNPIKITAKEIAQRLITIDPKSHKGTKGHALLIGGSHGKIGAVCLASKAALRTGCGLVTAFLPSCGYGVIQTAIPEVMVLTDDFEKFITDIKFDVVPKAIGIGPGMGQEIETSNALHRFLKSNTCALVIDADAINMISKNKTWLKLIPEKSILTPHPKELERLIGITATEQDKIEKIVALSKLYHFIIVIKGAPTIIIDGENIYQNTTGNVALATAGSGDVLTGIITSLVAQGYESRDASIIGVYLHGLTADIAAPEIGVQSFIASDIIDNIGKAWLKCTP